MQWQSSSSCCKLYSTVPLSLRCIVYYDMPKYADQRHMSKAQFTSSTSLMANRSELSYNSVITNTALFCFSAYLQDMINAKIDRNDAAWANQNVF